MVISQGSGHNAKCYRELQDIQNWKEAIVFANGESLVTLD